MVNVSSENVREYLELQVELTKKDFATIMEEFLTVYNERMKILEIILRRECDKVLMSKPEKGVVGIIEQIKSKINFNKGDADKIYHNISEYVNLERVLLESYRNDMENVLAVIDAMDEINNAI